MLFKEYLSPTDFILVEFPGIVKNLDKCIQTMGGIDSISSAYYGNNSLKLRLTENEYHTGVSAERRDLSIFSGRMHLVLKVRRKKNPTGAKREINAECLGIVSTIFSFKAIYDFQYLPIVQSGEFQHMDITPKLIPTDISSSLEFWNRNLDPSTPIPSYLPPFAFSRYYTPSKYLLNVTERINTNQQTPAFGKSLRPERKALTVNVNGTDPFPEKPSEAAVNDVDSRFKNEDYHKKIENLFNERPMWTRIAIAQLTGLHDSVLKVVLAKYAFYIMSGYGVVLAMIQKKQYIPEKFRVRLNKQAPSHERSISSLNYQYTPGQLPHMRQMWYSICDIDLPLANRICQKDFYGTLKQYNDLTGWLTSDKIDSIRAAIKEDVAMTAKKYSNDSEFGLEDSQDDEEQGVEDLEVFNY